MLSIPMTYTADEATNFEPLRAKRERYGDTVNLDARDLTPEMVQAIAEVAEKVGDRSVARVVEAIAAAREGDTDRAIPRLTAFPDMLVSYLRQHLIDGWVYKRGADGHLHAWLVTDVEYKEPRSNDDKPYVSMSLAANGSRGGSGRGGRGGALGMSHSSVTFHGNDVARRKVSDVLTKNGIYVETAALREDYDAQHERYVEILATGFAEQFRLTGQPMGAEDSWRTPNQRARAKVIHDLRSDEVEAPSEFTESILFGTEDEVEVEEKRAKPRKRRHGEEYGLGSIPTQFALRVFDLGTHEFLWVNTRDVERYVYDKSLAEKIVLPDDQRNLLDILTSNLNDFTGDVIEGKSAGNVILGKGVPGVGKTLTAEVYSELIERPLYSIHSGNLGTNAESVRKNLETTFERAQRWNAVLLLDEADVFVLERGANIQQNAIVAEFLRTLEYFTGLMFMTTNRANNIDDAILSRAAAIIDYGLPDRNGIREVWQVQARNQGTTIPDGLLDELVGGFETIAPRDVKMLLRLALRVAKGNGHDLDVDTFAKCAMFRGLHFAPNSRKD